MALYPVVKKQILNYNTSFFSQIITKLVVC